MTTRYLVDEDLPRSLARTLCEAAIDAVHVRDVGLRGCSDEEVLAYATREGRAIVTGDVGFGNILRFPLGQHPGIVVARLPNELSVGELNATLCRVLATLEEGDVAGNVVSVTLERVRIRRHPRT